MSKVLFIHADGSLAQLTKRDHDLLAERHDVQAFAWRGPLDFPRLLLAARRCDSLFSWSLGHHAGFANVAAWALGKASVVHVAGEDAVPTTGRLRDHAAVLLGLRLATRLVVSSDTSRRELAPRVGNVPLTVVPQAVDGERFRPGNYKEGSMVVTTAIVERSTIERKRLREYVAAARLLPGMQFHVVGPLLDDAARDLRRDAPGNVTFHGEVSHEHLVGLLQRARFYVQVSRHEAFGVALAEAMACDCIPVVSTGGAIPEVVGPGVYVPEPVTAEALADTLRCLGNARLPFEWRARVLERFPIRQRAAGLSAAVRPERLSGRGGRRHGHVEQPA